LAAIIPPGDWLAGHIDATRGRDAHYARDTLATGK
jgi:hypothetical protein